MLQDRDMPEIEAECAERLTDPMLQKVIRKHHHWITKVTHTASGYTWYRLTCKIGITTNTVYVYVDSQ